MGCSGGWAGRPCVLSHGWFQAFSWRDMHVLQLGQALGPVSVSVPIRRSDACSEAWLELDQIAGWPAAGRPACHEIPLAPCCAVLVLTYVVVAGTCMDALLIGPCIP